MYPITYEPKAIIFCPISTFGLPSIIVDGINVSYTPYLDGFFFSKSTTPYIIDIFIRLVYILNGTV